MERISASADPYSTENSDQHNPQDHALTDYSEKDKPWDTHRGESQDVQGIYATAEEFERYAERIGECSGVLRFGMVANKETGELSLKLRRAQFCRVRHCPVCQWRRSLMWQARFYKALPDIVAEYPTSRWLFLTLTARNCEIGELKDQLTAMNQAWNRLRARKEFFPIQGWLRTTEVTRGKDGSAHPHFHVLLMVPSNWFKTKKYVKQARWVELWREAMRLNYDPIVDIRTVKPKAPKEGQSPAESTAQALQAAVSETLKYSVKPADMTADADWFLEMTRQVHKKRFVASGGALKNVLKDDEETNEDLILADEPAEDEQTDGYLYAFNWRGHERKYRRFEKGDILLDDD
ncbi:protein rep [Escherichia coli]|jgi:plasmid rolling circle replication initiator protein Rep|uniref:protein rep n=1 Tax=Klebsiella pneumoniae TaxID=573 RepID=UPI00109D01A4|nr:protein rep [Klebsiella pneumoniae]ELF0166469.1 protein rep [Salmonella enterica subsp. enterica serovar Schwarzengrund]MBF0070255.1 protein rep [Escherichia coli]EIW8495397.1 Replication protein [Klebsiella pneumoniae]MBF0083440.1 protein rep [Escherichia coli]MEA4301880.1 protein rep [Klebsiella pneumoniae]